MPSLLRARLTCFYCGNKSSQSKTAGLRVWHCTKCDADNWLDKAGCITDPPTSTTASTRLDAQMRSTEGTIRSNNQPSQAAASIFCSTCLKNQAMITESLASYYPHDDDPTFDRYVSAESDYREGLERRYPPLCQACEPRAREALRRANYGAKADHVRRTLDRLKGHRLANVSPIQSALLHLGSVCWHGAWVGDIIWHLLSLLENRGYGTVTPVVPTNHECIKMVIDHRVLSPNCAGRFSGFVIPILFGMALLSAWWHPRLRQKLQDLRTRVVGYQIYHSLQALTLAIRWGFWQWTNTTVLISTDTVKAAHLFMAIFDIVLMSNLYRAIRIHQNIKVDWSQSPEPLRTLGAQEETSQTALPHANQLRPSPIPFSINDLAPPASQSQSIIPRLPTPPPEADYDSVSAMDWTPTQTLSPNIRRPVTKVPSISRPSPFHGTLPASVVSPAHRLRNPPNQPYIHKASEAKKASLFTRPRTDQAMTTSSHLAKARPSGHALDLTSLTTSLDPSMSNDSEDESPTKTSITSTTTTTPFARQKFFPPGITSDTQETGLEGLLASTFSLGETPPEVLVSNHDSDSAIRTRPRRQSLLPNAVIDDEGHILKRYLVLAVILLLLGFAWMNLNIAVAEQNAAAAAAATANGSGRQGRDHVLSRAVREVERVWGRMGI